MMIAGRYCFTLRSLNCSNPTGLNRPLQSNEDGYAGIRLANGLEIELFAVVQIEAHVLLT